MRIAQISVAAALAIALAFDCSGGSTAPTDNPFAHDTIELADLNNVPLPAPIAISAGDTEDVAGGFVTGAFVPDTSLASSYTTGPCNYSIDVGHYGAHGNSLSTVTGNATCLWFATWHAEATFSIDGQERRFDFIAPQYR
jgi:hypothetical protein